MLNATNITIYALLTLFVLVAAKTAADDGFGTQQQARKSVEKGDFLSFWGNLTNLSSLFLINPVVALIIGNVAPLWTMTWPLAIFLVVAIAQAFAVRPLLEDSKTTPSAFYRDGLFALAGAMQFLLFSVQTSVIVAFYILTPRNAITSQTIAWISVALAIGWAISIIQPPIRAHGKIELVHWLTAAGGAAMIFIGHTYLTW